MRFGPWLVTLVACGRIGFDPAAGAVDASAPPGDALAVAPSSALAFSAGLAHACLTRSGLLACWGLDQEGEVGVAPLGGNVVTPFRFPGGTTWTSVAAGELVSCGITSAGTIECWGSNFNGEDGVGMFQGSTAMPMPIAAVGTWREVAVRRYHTCGIRNDGTLWCWGQNDYGQLGLGDLGSATDRYVPTQVDAATDWASVAVGGNHSCAAKRDGTTYCWGDNQFGCVGSGDFAARLVPTSIASSVRLAKLVMGKQHSCGLDGGGGLWCWGENNLGQLGLGDFVNRDAPTRIGSATYLDVAASWFHTCAIRSDHTLWCWGDNTFGAYAPATGAEPVPRQIATQQTWAAVTGGNNFTCLLDVTGQAYCMGANMYGNLGTGDTNRRDGPTAINAP